MKTAGGRKPMPVGAVIAALVPIGVVVLVALVMSAGRVGAAEPGPTTAVTETATVTETVTEEVTVTETAEVQVEVTATETVTVTAEPTPSGTFDIGEPDEQTPEDVCLYWDLEHGIVPAEGQDPCAFAVQDGDGPLQTPPGYTGEQPQDEETPIAEETP